MFNSWPGKDFGALCILQTSKPKHGFFFFLPQKLCGNPAGVPRKSFVILMGIQGCLLFVFCYDISIFAKFYGQGGWEKKWWRGKKMKNEAVRNKMKKKENGERKKGKGKRRKGKGGEWFFLLIYGTLLLIIVY